MDDNTQWYLGVRNKQAEEEVPTVEQIKEYSPEQRRAMLRLLLGLMRRPQVDMLYQRVGARLPRQPMRRGVGKAFIMRLDEMRRVPFDKRPQFLQNMFNAMDHDSVAEEIDSYHEGPKEEGSEEKTSSVLPFLYR